MEGHEGDWNYCSWPWIDDHLSKTRTETSYSMLQILGGKAVPGFFAAVGLQWGRMFAIVSLFASVCGVQKTWRQSQVEYFFCRQIAATAINRWCVLEARELMWLVKMLQGTGPPLNSKPTRCCMNVKLASAMYTAQIFKTKLLARLTRGRSAAGQPRLNQHVPCPWWTTWWTVPVRGVNWTTMKKHQTMTTHQTTTAIMTTARSSVMRAVIQIGLGMSGATPFAIMLNATTTAKKKKKKKKKKLRLPWNQELAQLYLRKVLLLPFARGWYVQSRV